VRGQRKGGEVERVLAADVRGTLVRVDGDDLDELGAVPEDGMEGPVVRREGVAATGRPWRQQGCGHGRAPAPVGMSRIDAGCSATGAERPGVVVPSRWATDSATRIALAMIVSVGSTAVLETKKLESAT